MYALALALAVVVADPVSPAPRPALELLRQFRDELIYIRPGEGPFPARFTLGRNADEPTERPLQQAYIKHKFSISKYEVTQELWELIMGGNPSRWKGPRNSVDNVSFNDCVEFCHRLTLALREVDLISATEVVRLPSETEWEYCARAGTISLYSFGDDVEQLDDYAWYESNAAGNDPQVGEKKPNAWGLYDMHGYLWEWCADRWHDTLRDIPADGSVWNVRGDIKRRTLRGGSWKDPAKRVLSTTRRGAYTTTRDDALGLRCVVSDTLPSNQSAVAGTPGKNPLDSRHTPQDNY
ncbi:MAG: formylglycine-generating enzyme family protein [Pirellulales bacterium]|nr:formylglycine-generating enzyme family protein [Pirellulales bacterium]